MEILRKGSEQELTEHLNSVDTTCSIKFTYEEDSENSLPFLDTRMVRMVNEIVKLLGCRKKTHTYQYLKVTSHHLLHQNFTRRDQDVTG